MRTLSSLAKRTLRTPNFGLRRVLRFKATLRAKRASFLITTQGLKFRAKIQSLALFYLDFEQTDEHNNL